MNIKNFIKSHLNIKGYSIENIEIKHIHQKNDFIQEVVYIHLEPRKNKVYHCPICHKKCKGYDTQYQSRTWRCMDLFGYKCYLCCKLPRVSCIEHGIITASVPFAYHNSRFTKEFELYVGYLALQLSKSEVSQIAMIDWHTVGSILSRVRHIVEPDLNKRLDNLRYIAVDETSYKKGHKYITVVINLENNEVVWMAKNHGKTVFKSFFESLSDEQISSIQVIAADGAKWVDEVIKEVNPDITRCIDTFHCVEWALSALDDVRKTIASDVKKPKEKRSKGRPRKGEQVEKNETYKHIKKSKYPLGKNPENLTEYQTAHLELILATNPTLNRAYQLKEKLRLLFKLKDKEEVINELTSWLSWAQRCRINEFVELAKKIKRHYDAIINTITLGINSAKIESTNNKIKLLIRKAYGFRNFNNLTDMIYMTCSSYKLNLPCRGLPITTVIKTNE